MDKWIRLVVLLLIFIILPIQKTYAENDSSVYCSKEEAESVYNIAMTNSDFADLLRDRELTLPKDRIMPVWTFDLLNYGRTGTLSIKPMICNGHTSQEITSGNMYVSRVDMKDGGYGGFIEFCIEDGRGYIHLYDSSDEYDQKYFDPDEPVSYSFGDDSQRSNTYSYQWYLVGGEPHVDFRDSDMVFRSVGRQTNVFATEKNTRFISAARVVYGFYVDSEDSEDLFVYPAIYDTGNYRKKTSYLGVDSDLKAIAESDLNDYEDLKNNYENWSKEHPDEKWQAPQGVFPFKLDFTEVNPNESKAPESMSEPSSTEEIVESQVEETASKEELLQPEASSKIGETTGSPTDSDRQNTDSNRNEKGVQTKNLSFLYWLIPLLSVGFLTAGFFLFRLIGKKNGMR